MSLIPDGIGHIAYASKPNAGPLESGLINDTSYSFASTGQEQQQRQLYDLTHSTSSYVQLQQQQAATEEQLYLLAGCEEIVAADYDAQRLEAANYIGLLNCNQTGGRLLLEEESNGGEELAYQQQITFPEQFLNEERQQQQHRQQIPDHNQNLIQQATLLHSVPVSESEREIEVQLTGTHQEQLLAGQKQIRSADQDFEQDKYQLKGEVYPITSREELFLDFAQSSSREHIELIEQRPTRLDRITIAVRKSLLFLRENCERLTAEADREQEQEHVQSQIKGILTLRQKLIDVCPHLIDNPNPKAWFLLKEIILGIDSASVLLCQPLGQRADAVWTPEHSAKPVSPMGLEVLNRIRKIITGWYKNNDTQSDQDEEAGSGSGPAGSLQDRNQRKRRIPEDEPPLIKYRRVDNSFPRYIPNETAEEQLPAKSMAEREGESENRRQFAKRLSIFNAPTLIQHRVRNNATNIHIDLSDDDEPLPAFGPGSSYRPSAPTGLGMNSDSSTNSNSSLAMRPQMLSPDAVRVGQNGFPESRMNGHPNPMRSPLHGEDSLLNQEDRRSEREQYLSLLRNLCHDKSAIRAINNSKPPPLQLLNRTAEPRSGAPTWASILANNKPPPLRQQQHQLPLPPLPPKPVSNNVNRELADYAKLLVREQQKNTPPLMRMGSAKSITSHASTISISESTSSSSNSSNASEGVPANDDDDNSSDGQAAAAAAAAHTGAAAAPLKSSLDTEFNTTVTRYELMQRQFANCVFFRDTFAEDFTKRSERKHEELEHRRQLAVMQAEKSREARREFEKTLLSNIFQYRLTHKPLLVIGPVDTPSDRKEAEFIPLTEEHMKHFNELITGPPHQVLVSKFSLQITRNDIRTLLGSSWLNDEVINFYMNLLTERSELRSGELPSVYAMNTFFVPRLLQNGHGGVKRWTRKVDLFSKDIIPVPVHCNGVHWCMAIIHMRNKTIRYYDSMGKPNQDVLDALESYLRQESLDKRKQPFDTSDFRIESVPNVPQQTNGSDCGVFSCMFAEYITRDAPITFSQDNMDYFRKKMVLEIAGGQLWK